MIKQWNSTCKLLWLLPLFLFFSCKGQEKVKISNELVKIVADSISYTTEFLPEFKIYRHSDEPQGNPISGVVRTMIQDKNSLLWFGSQNGLCCLKDKYLTYFDIKDSLGNSITVKAIVEDSNGNIWIGHDGLTKYDGKHFINYSEKNGLINNDIWSLAVDKKGIIWIGTLQGVSKFDGEKFTNFKIPDAEPDHTRGVTSAKIVHSIMVDTKGKVWFGTNGGAYFYDGKTLINISEKDGLCNNNVNVILEDKQGNIWFGTTHNGLCYYDGETFKNIPITKGKEVWSLMEDKQGNIWFSVKGFGVYCYNGKIVKSYSEKEGLSSVVFNIFEDSNNRIWCNGFKGSYRLEGEKFIYITRDGPW